MCRPLTDVYGDTGDTCVPNVSPTDVDVNIECVLLFYSPR